MRYRDVAQKFNDVPFKPFKMHLSDGSMILVQEAGPVILGASSGVFPTAYIRDEEGNKIAKNWRTVAFSHMVQFSDMDETVEGKRRKRK